MGLFDIFILVFVIYLIYMYFFQEKEKFTQPMSYTPSVIRNVKKSYPKSPEDIMTNEFSRGLNDSNYDHAEYIYQNNVTSDMVETNRRNQEKGKKNRNKIEQIFEPPPQKFYGPYRRSLHNFKTDNGLQTSGVDMSELLTKWQNVI